MKRVLGHVITFTLGTVVSGTVATAAVTNYVQAQKQKASIVVSGKSTSTTELVYNGRAYLPIGDIQSILAKAGARSKWTAGHLAVTLATKTSTTGNQTPTGNGQEAKTNLTMVQAITSSMLDLGTTLKDLGNAMITDGQNNDVTAMTTDAQTAMTKLDSNVQTVSQVTPGDAAGKKILNDYLNVLKQYQTTFQDLLTALNNNDSSAIVKIQSEMDADNTAMTNFDTEWAAFLKS